MTSQKTFIDNELILETSLVSIYNQSMARTEIRGMEANKAPKNELRFAISEIATIDAVVNKIFTI